MMIILQLTHEDQGWLIGSCPCGAVSRIIGGDDYGEAIPAENIAENLRGLLDHVRQCAKAKTADQQLVDQLTRERYGLPPRSTTG